MLGNLPSIGTLSGEREVDPPFLTPLTSDGSIKYYEIEEMRMYPAAARLRARASAVAVVLFLLALLPALSGAHAAPQPALPTPALPPAIQTTDSAGTPSGNFWVGLSSGQVYFHAYDASGDTTAVVAINDQNATRDGLTNPVAHWTANFTLNVNNFSFLWHTYYELPLGLNQGGRWNITLDGTHAGFLAQNFTVHTFEVSATSFRNAYLQGHVASVLVTVERSVNGAPLTPTTLVMSGEYLLKNFTPASLFGAKPLVLTPSGYGVATFTVPLNAANDSAIALTIWANLTGSSGTESEFASAEVDVGVISVSLGLSLSLNGPLVSVLPANTATILTVSVTETAFFGYSAGDNLSVAISFQGPNGDLSTVPGNPPLTLRSDSEGYATVLFTSSNTTFKPLTPYTIWANVTDPMGPSFSKNNTLTFTVAPALPAGEGLSVSVGQEDYFGGDSITANWMLGGTNGATLPGWTTDSWLVYDASGGFSIYTTGTIGSTSGSGSFSFTAPLHYAGELEIWVTAHNATETIENYAITAVSLPTILLSASDDNYLPGDTVHVSVSPQGSVLSSADLWGSATASGGPVLWSGPVSGDSFSFQVPSVGTPNSIQINVTAQSPTLGVLSSAAMTIERASGWILATGIQTHSSYSDGSFQPGQTITIHYEISSLANQPVPGGTIYLYLETYQYLPGQGNVYTQTTSTSGNLAFTIPSNWGNGEHYMYVYAEFQSCFTGSCYAESDFTVPVQSSPAALDYELVPNSGLTVGWLILLVVILVVAVLLVLLIRRRPPTGGAGPITPYKSGEGSAPASGDGAKSSDASGDSSGGASSPGTPPLPNPSPGEGGSR
jgi:hypothetical protein